MLPGCPKDMDVGGKLVAVVTTDDVLVIASKDKILSEVSIYIHIN